MTLALTLMRPPIAWRSRSSVGVAVARLWSDRRPATRPVTARPRAGPVGAAHAAGPRRHAAARPPLGAAELVDALLGRRPVAGASTPQGLQRAAVRRWRWRAGGEMVAVVASGATDRSPRASPVRRGRVLSSADGGTAWTPRRAAGQPGCPFKRGRRAPTRRLARASRPERPVRAQLRWRDDARPRRAARPCDRRCRPCSIAALGASGRRMGKEISSAHTAAAPSPRT